MRKNGFFMAAALVFLAGCGNKDIPADAGTMTAVESSADSGTDDLKTEDRDGKNHNGKFIPAPIDVSFDYEYLNEWDNGKEILRGKAPVIRVLGSGHEELQKALDAYCEERLKVITEEYNHWLPIAKEEYENNKENFPGYYLESNAVPERLDEKIVSFSRTEGSYFGGAHPNYFIGGINIDTETGRALSLEDVVTDRERLHEYAHKYLGEEMGLDELFPDYKESLDSHFQSENSDRLQWIMDAEGLRLLFSPYDLGPYAMGSIEILVPYAENSELIKKEYILEGNGLSKRIPQEEEQEADLDGDGTMDRLLFNARNYETDGEPDYFSTVTVSTGRGDGDLKSTEYQLPGGFTEAYLMRTEDGRSYLYVESWGDNDYRLMEVFDLNGETPVHAGTVGDTPKGHLLSSPDNFTLYTWMDALGSYNGRRRYQVGADGMPEALDTVYEINAGEQWERSITAERSVPVWMESGGDGEEKVRTELPAGTKFCPVRTDGETFVEARLEDGRLCEIRYELEDYRRFIEGVDEWEYFKDLPYAG